MRAIIRMNLNKNNDITNEDVTIVERTYAKNNKKAYNFNSDKSNQHTRRINNKQ